MKTASSRTRPSACRIASLALLAFIFNGVGAWAASMNEMNHGPFVSWTIRGEGGSITYKGIVIRLSENPSAAICFDTDLLRVSAAWTGGFLQWYPERDGLERNPTIEGTVHFRNDASPGWSTNGVVSDPRRLPYGPLPRAWGRYDGLFVHTNKIVLAYSVADCRILELPGFERISGEPFFVRTFELSSSSQALSLRLFRIEGKNPRLSFSQFQTATNVLRFSSESENRLIGFTALPPGANWEIAGGHVVLALPPLGSQSRFRIFIGREPRLVHETLRGQLQKFIEQNRAAPSLRELCQGGPPQWTPVLETPISPGTENYALAMDSLAVPEQNPWRSWIRFGGVDFLDADRAILGSVSGDVWLVSGLSRTTGKLEWKRYATGLYQPLDVRIVDGQIHVLGRDQITRLHDLNRDGEADYYENFNNDWMVAENFHCFVLNLETDSQGNFYFAQGAPWPPKVETPHQGVLFKLSREGKDLEVFADGLRGPNGMAISPDDLIVYSDNEGHWLPTCSLQWVRPGGFHGMKPTAHLHSPTPSDFEKPICWIPHSVDNSPGDPVWVPRGQWGPLAGKMLLTSYGKATLSLVMTETIEGTRQGGTIPLPLRFPSGLIRARFNPSDGHLYLCGLSVWQTAGVKPGGFYRVRYANKPFHLPVELKAKRDGIELTFSEPLDAAAAADAGNFHVEQWNHRWVDTYGSPDYSVRDPDRKGRDAVEIRGLELSPDRRRVMLRTEPLQPVMQMRVTYNLQAADGTPLRHDIYNTVNRLP
ncbi:MAG: SMP-30/gluconolactonase/LRE family protein [Verrucomicrobiales bacterium]|nr:SMP-30/gluconolactonase/LRE family protein [Verrucomicrobiales bacterium]